MKLWHSFIKELKLSSRGFYFYVELVMAVILLAVVLFVVPEDFTSKETEYIYFDLPQEMIDGFKQDMLEEDLNGKAEDVEIKSNKQVFSTELYETDEKKHYIVESEAAVIHLADSEKAPGVILNLDDAGKLHFIYYLQGYESERLKNIFLVVHNRDIDVLVDEIDKQVVRSLETYDDLNDRENTIPPILTFNGSLMGLFIIAAYIFLDKQEGIIKAYAITPSSVWHYLMSKVGVIILTSTISSFIVVLPVMGTKPNYLLLLVLLIASGFFASALGLLVASFYKNMMQAFGAVYVIMIAMILPNIAYFIPSWEPVWIKIIPTYPLIQGFKETLLANGDMTYVWYASIGFIIGGSILFLMANQRFKRTLAA